MKSSPDPSIHRDLEIQFVDHVEKLLGDERLRLDTTRGRRPVTMLFRTVTKNDRSLELRRSMDELGKRDRELEARMPTGQTLDVGLSQKRLFFFKSPVGRLRVACVSPTRSLLAGEAGGPMTPQEVTQVLSQTPPPLAEVPSTLVILSTAGFTIEAREAAERRIDRTVVLVEPNGVGGWNVYGPPETKALADLFDPEGEERKRQRVREMIDASAAELSTSGIATDKVAGRTQLPVQLVEAELKSYAKAHPGLVAKRLDGRVVLFREGAAVAPSAGGSKMPFLDSVKALFSRKGETEKKIAFLAERRTALSQQLDRGYEEIASLESKEADLRSEFKAAGGEITKRRITGQMVQLRKEVERREQLLTVLKQQVNVVGTHLHNLQLVQQGQAAELPDSDELAQDAAAAEDVLAKLEADNELADTVGTGVHGGMSAEEEAMYQELSLEAGTGTSTESTAASEDAKTKTTPPPLRMPSAAAENDSGDRNRARRSEPEAG